MTDETKDIDDFDFEVDIYIYIYIYIYINIDINGCINICIDTNIDIDIDIEIDNFNIDASMWTLFTLALLKRGKHSDDKWVYKKQFKFRTSFNLR